MNQNKNSRKNCLNQRTPEHNQNKSSNTPYQYLLFVGTLKLTIPEERRWSLFRTSKGGERKKKSSDDIESEGATTFRFRLSQRNIFPLPGGGGGKERENQEEGDREKRNSVSVRGHVDEPRQMNRERKFFEKAGHTDPWRNRRMEKWERTHKALLI